MSGAPQGSVLGPILVLICVNELVDGISNNVLTFEGDTTVLRQIIKEMEIRKTNFGNENAYALYMETRKENIKWGYYNR